MIINSASDVIYNGASVQALYYNGRQVWPVTKSAVSLTLRHTVYPTASSNTLSVTAYDPYTKINMYGSLQSSFASSKWDYVPMNSDLTITCGRAVPFDSMFYFDDSAYYGTSLRIKANRDLDVSARFFSFSGKRFSASGYVYPLPYTQEISAQRWKLPLVVTNMSGCVWSAARTGLAEYTDLNGNVHSSSVPCSWIYCPDGYTKTLQSSQYSFSIRHSSFITTNSSSSYPYSASVKPLFYIPNFSTGIDHGEQSSLMIGGNWSVPNYLGQNPPTLLSASSVDVYWENDVNSPTVTSTASLYPVMALYSGDIAMRSFGTWSISGVWG